MACTTSFNDLPAPLQALIQVAAGALVVADVNVTNHILESSELIDALLVNKSQHLFTKCWDDIHDALLTARHGHPDMLSTLLQLKWSLVEEVEERQWSWADLSGSLNGPQRTAQRKEVVRLLLDTHANLHSSLKHGVGFYGIG